MNPQKRPYKATMLAGSFFGFAVLRVIALSFYPSYGWEYLLINTLPSCLIFLICGVVVLKQWTELSFLRKSVFVGIGINYVLNFLWDMASLMFFMERSLSGVGFWLSYYPYIILNPLYHLYDKVVIMPRTSHLAGGSVLIKIYYWESGLLSPVLQSVYAGLIGYSLGKSILSYRKYRTNKS